ncbi:Peroxisome biogenesis protein 22 [Camellia lanceoleosa]|uniref:Peroxisome biogenesis protein 22 n=1 Tax=Camellia lanceoleosa TaxID=1840588 RepID=A0ACC0HPN3_9ERIC|nr:Peroxisome biogenesis protein 22 [Camellia lanceoleosa]
MATHRLWKELFDFSSFSRSYSYAELFLLCSVWLYLYFLITCLVRISDTQSIGALAGLAIAILFTWRLLRSTSAAQRRQPKRQATNPSSSGVVSTHSNANLTFSGDLSSEDSRAQNVIDEFFQPIKPTLGQIVRQKLSEGRKVTCWLLGVVLEETSPEELQKQATVRSSVLEVLLEITKFCDLYLMERVLDVESEIKVWDAQANYQHIMAYWKMENGVTCVIV